MGGFFLLKRQSGPLLKTLKATSIFQVGETTINRNPDFHVCIKKKVEQLMTPPLRDSFNQKEKTEQV